MAGWNDGQMKGKIGWKAGWVEGWLGGRLDRYSAAQKDGLEKQYRRMEGSIERNIGGGTDREKHRRKETMG